MGTSLTGTKPKDTYDSLIKVGDNGPISGTVKTLSDGLGNDLPIAVSTSNVGIGTTTLFTKMSIANSLSATSIGTNYNAGILNIQNTNTTNGNLSLIGFQDASASINLAAVGAINTVHSGSPNSVVGELGFYTKASGGGYVTERMRITSAGVVDLAQGQIKFPATQVASADANTLDDYEEGTWTMGVSFGGASVGVAYSANTGTYTKVGRKVTANGFLALSSKGSSSGTARITGLPFTIASGDSNYSAPSVWLNRITFADQFQAYGNTNATTIDLSEITNLGVLSFLTEANFANNSEFMISLTYFV